MLAGIEEALQTYTAGEVEEEMTAIETLLSGLFDYAGLYPPASLDMRTAVQNYLRYVEGAHRGALGRFVVHADCLGELRDAARERLRHIRLSVIVAADGDLRRVLESLGHLNDVTLECKVASAANVERVKDQLPVDAECYLEIPMETDDGLLDAVKLCGAQAKLRMGGVTAEAFPSPMAIVKMLKALGERQLPFKATAGLHHPIRSRHAFTYEAGSAEGTMHGFMNLACAAAELHFGGAEGDAMQIFEEEDPGAWQVASDEIQCRGFRWSLEQMHAVRQQFLISIGSCSFEEPMHDLESLGWL
jgi:hypothetical protein